MCLHWSVRLPVRLDLCVYVPLRISRCLPFSLSLAWTAQTSEIWSADDGKCLLMFVSRRISSASSRFTVDPGRLISYSNFVHPQGSPAPTLQGGRWMSRGWPGGMGWVDWVWSQCSVCALLARIVCVPSKLIYYLNGVMEQTGSVFLSLSLCLCLCLCLCLIRRPLSPHFRTVGH